MSSTSATVKKLWKRAGLLYLLSIVFTLLYVTWALLLPESKIPLPMWQKSVESFFFNLLTARYSYGWTDFLPRYAVFMFLAPALLWVIAKGKWWAVGIASVAVWALLGRVQLFMPFAAWQLLFTGGMVIGYYLPAMKEFWNNRLSRVSRVGITGTAYVASIISFALLIFTLVVIPYINVRFNLVIAGDVTQAVQSFATYFDKQTLGVGRIGLGIIWFTSLYLFMRSHEKSINRITYGVLEVFGKNSLFVYGLHAFVIFGLTAIFAPVTTTSILANTIVTTVILVAIYMITRYRHTIMGALRWLELKYRHEAVGVRGQEYPGKFEYNDS